MKKCTQCGKEYTDDKSVCEIDAWPLVDSTVAQKQAVEAKMGWLERQFAKTNIIVLIGGTLFFAYMIPFGSVVIAVISGIVMFRSDPPVRGKAATVFLVQLVCVVIAVLAALGIIHVPEGDR